MYEIPKTYEIKVRCTNCGAKMKLKQDCGFPARGVVANTSCMNCRLYNLEVDLE